MSRDPVRHSISNFLALLGLGGGSSASTRRGAVACRSPAIGPHPPLLPLLDARSPLEFSQGHIPGALSLPLFSDEERASVGTLYKEQGHETAVLHGLACVGPRLEALARRLLEAAGPGRELAVYCSRGGMRSASLAWLCGPLGVQAHVLDGGYKTFRRYVLQYCEAPCALLVLGGRTGSGKTEALHRMAGLGAQVVDLEGLARHRGSAFGYLADSPQPTCEQFENSLAVALGQCDPAAPVWVEDECENLGSVNLPRPFFRQVRDAPVLVLQVPEEARLARVLVEYGDMPPEEMATCLDRIQKRLGGLQHKTGRACIENGDLPGLAAILLGYYDKAYEKQLRDRRLIALAEAESAEAAAPLLLRLAQAITLEGSGRE